MQGNSSTAVAARAQPAYIGSIGYYGGDLKQARTNAKRNESVFVTLDELKLISLHTSGSSPEEIDHERKTKDKSDRFKLSKQRILNWENTIAGQQRKRIQAREEKEAQEEREKLKIDEAYKREEDAQRQAALERAKKLQYFEKDAVKNLHSKIMLYRVLEERDQQLELKKNVFNPEQYLDEKYTKIAEVQALESMKSEYRKMQQERQKEIKLAEEQKRQADEKRQRDISELKSTAEEGDRIRKQDAEYRAEQERLGRENNTKSKNLQQELISMIKQAEDKRLSDKNHIAKEEEKAENWKSRKMKQWKTRKEVEKRWFDDALRVRETMGERQLKQNTEDTKRYELEVSKAMKDKDQKDTEMGEMKEKNKKKLAVDMKDYFQMIMAKNEQMARERREEDKRQLMEYERIRIEAQELKRKKKEELLRQGKELQNFHLKQMEQATQRRHESKSNRLRDELASMGSSIKEDNLLLEYVDQLEKEGWAVGNARLRRYIDESIRRPCQSNAAKFQAQFGNPAPLSSSKERLGFIGPYTKVDLARNSIPAGDFLKNAGVDGFSNAGGLPVGGVTLKQFV